MRSIADRWQRFERTKAYDFALAFPLAVYYCERLWERWPQFRDAFGTVLSQPDLLSILQLMVEIGTYGFVGGVILMLLIRVPPVAKAPGVWPRIAGFFGTFATLAFLAIKPVDLPLGLQFIAALLAAGGCFFGLYGILWLGRSFSIMAEARKLRTRGAYAFVRHPLYLAEELIVLGAVLQYQQPWAALIGAAQFGLQLWRIHNEEQVLAQAFPEYSAYAAKTARLIPGIY